MVFIYNLLNKYRQVIINDKTFREKNPPISRHSIALANSFAVAASTGKPAKIIDAIHSARKHDKEFHTNFLARISRLSGQKITDIKKMRVGDIKPTTGLRGRLHNTFKNLSREMEEAIQSISHANESDTRETLRRVAPAQQHKANGAHLH